MKQEHSRTRDIVLVTGPSGAGRTTAVRILEDLGFEAIENIPLRLVQALLDDPEATQPLALVIDPRTRDFSVKGVMDLMGQLARDPDVRAELLYLDCAPSVLLRRFSETRRRHPLAGTDRVEAGVEREFDLVGDLKVRADILIDTSDLNVHQLRGQVEKWFLADKTQKLSISIQSFSYKRGLPRAADMVFDCRFLKNPYWEPTLRDANGISKAVQDYVNADPRADGFAERVSQMVLWLLPAYIEEGKSHFSVAFGCTGGQHRSVAMAERLALVLMSSGWHPTIRHRDMDRIKKGEASA